MPTLISPPRTLAQLAALLGGETYAAGRRALVPAPGHRPADRSVSLLLVEGRLVVHGFGACDWRAVLDDLRARGWIDAENRLRGGDPGPPWTVAGLDRTRSERIAAARRLWAGAGPITPDSAAAAYGRARRVRLDRVGRSALRAHPAVALSIYRQRGPRLAALLAGVLAADGALTAVEVTYLDARGARSRLARPSRKIVGVIPPGSAVRLADVAEEMLVAEGVFTALSAMARFGLPAWALLSTSNLRRWTAPEGVRRVLIAGDRGPDGERSARILRRALAGAGVVAEIVWPPPGLGDWNDLARQEGEEEGRAGAPGSQG